MYIILTIIVTYSVSVGIVSASCKYSKLFKTILKSLDISKSDKKVIVGAAILFAPISVIILIMIQIAYLAYNITKDVIYIFSD